MIFIMQSLFFRAFVHVCRFRLFATLVTILGSLHAHFFCVYRALNTRFDVLLRKHLIADRQNGKKS